MIVYGAARRRERSASSAHEMPVLGSAACSSPGRAPIVCRTQAFPGRLRPGQLRAGFLAHRAPLRIVGLPRLEVGTAIEQGQSLIADVGVESTEL